jgi:hypothetical protein
VLLAADGLPTRAIGREVGCTTGTASKLRVRYAERRLAGLDETGNRGNDPKYAAETDKRILAVLDCPAPQGYARWTGPLIASALGDVDVQYIWRFLRAQNVDLAARKSWCESNNPGFAAKAAEIVGLYLDPPRNALVLAIDEKPSIQALELKQGYLKLANGRALTGQSHDYKQHGTTTLFAAFNIARFRYRHRQSDWTALQKTAQGRVSRLYEPRLVQLGRRTQGPYRSLHPQLQRDRQAVRLAVIESLSKTPKAPFRGSVIQGTSVSSHALRITKRLCLLDALRPI